MNDVVRIAMWSGPRNISTAMMRSFGARPDTIVVDEPFYAIYLLATGIDHPLREESIASQPHDPKIVADKLLGSVPAGKTIFYQKHMTHHMVPAIKLDWMAQCRNAFLIRDPRLVIASYSQKRSEVTMDDIGLVRQQELFQREAERLGAAPPVVDGSNILKDPAYWLAKLCQALSIDYSDAMLSWPAGKRDTDGVWAPVWYHNVEQSTGFAPPRSEDEIQIPEHLKQLVDDAMPYYQDLRRYHLR